MDIDIESPIIDKAKEFLEAPKKYSENLSEILDDLKVSNITRSKPHELTHFNTCIPYFSVTLRHTKPL